MILDDLLLLWAVPAFNCLYASRTVKDSCLHEKEAQGEQI